MTAFHDQFETFLKENDSRYTTQKKEIVTEILKINYHFEVDEFVAKMKQKMIRKSNLTNANLEPRSLQK